MKFTYYCEVKHVKDKLKWRWFGAGVTLFLLQTTLLSPIGLWMLLVDLVCCMIFLWVILSGTSWFNDFGQKIDWKGVMIGFTSLLVVGLLSLYIVGETSNQNVLLEKIKLVGWIKFIVATCLIAPLGEEILFRRFLIGTKVTWIRIIISGLAFGWAHTLNGFSLSGLVVYTIPGIILGGVYGKRRNILDSIATHGLYNTVQVILLMLGVQ